MTQGKEGYPWDSEHHTYITFVDPDGTIWHVASSHMGEEAVLRLRRQVNQVQSSERPTRPIGQNPDG